MGYIPKAFVPKVGNLHQLRRDAKNNPMLLALALVGASNIGAEGMGRRQQGTADPDPVNDLFAYYENMVAEGVIGETDGEQTLVNEINFVRYCVSDEDLNWACGVLGKAVPTPWRVEKQELLEFAEQHMAVRIDTALPQEFFDAVRKYLPKDAHPLDHFIGTAYPLTGSSMGYVLPFTKEGWLAWVLLQKEVLGTH